MKYSALLTLAILIASCGAEEVQPVETRKVEASDNYVMFGSFHGFCGGEECVEIFMLDQSGLYEDIKDVYPSRETAYNPELIKLSDAKYEAVKNLDLTIPDYLMESTDTVFGCPDCADAGGIYLEIKQNGNRRFWILDKQKYQMDEELHPIVDAVREAIELINQ